MSGSKRVDHENGITAADLARHLPTHFKLQAIHPFSFETSTLISINMPATRKQKASAAAKAARAEAKKFAAASHVEPWPTNAATTEKGMKSISGWVYRVASAENGQLLQRTVAKPGLSWEAKAEQAIESVSIRENEVAAVVTLISRIRAACVVVSRSGLPELSPAHRALVLGYFWKYLRWGFVVRSTREYTAFC